MNVAVASRVGTNCWSPARFTGGNCDRLLRCKYPEKEKCKAHIDQIFTIKVPKRTFAKEALPCRNTSAPTSK
jgi:hypothetical protein